MSTEPRIDVVYQDVTVIERRPKNSFESEKAYLYLIDARGQQMTNLLGLTARIYSKAVSSFDFKELNVLLPSGEMKVRCIRTYILNADSLS